jgi:hypothetical protein
MDWLRHVTLDGILFVLLVGLPFFIVNLADSSQTDTKSNLQKARAEKRGIPFALICDTFIRIANLFCVCKLTNG